MSPQHSQRVSSSSAQTSPEFEKLILDLEALPHTRALSDQTLESIYGLAYHLVDQRHYERAYGYFKFLSFYRPTNPQYVAALGLCARRLGYFDEAIYHYSFATLLEPQSVIHTLAVAECQMLKGLIEEAKETLGIVIAVCLERGNEESLRQRAESLLDITNHARPTA